VTVWNGQENAYTMDEGEGERELSELRAEVADLRAKLTAAEAQARAGRRAGRRRVSWHGPVSALLITLACVLAPVSVLGVWTANQVSNTSRYVQTVSPLINAPAVRGALTDKITTAVTTKLNVQGVAIQAAKQLSAKGFPRLGGLLSSFSGSIAGAVNGFIHSTVAKIVASPAVRRLWVQGNTLAHAQMVKALSGQSSSVTVSNGKVTVGLGPIIDQVKHNLAARGLTLVNKLPPINPTISLFSAKYLVQAQTLYRLLNTLRWLLPILTLLLFAAGIYVARSHRRALIGSGLGLAGAMLLLGLGLALGRSIYLNKIPASIPADAAAVVFDTLVRFIKQGLRVLLVLGLVVAVAAFFAGPSVTAVRARQAFTSGFAYVRGAGQRVGLTTGPVGTFVYRYRTALRVVAVSVAALIFVFWTDPTGLVVLTIALVLLLVIGLLELIGRPPAKASPGQPT
jgi:hypothetical protein